MLCACQSTFGCTWMSSLSPSTSFRSRTASMRRSLDTDIHKICSITVKALRRRAAAGQVAHHCVH